MVGLETVSLVAFAFSAGIFTFFAPCAYPLLPGYVSYYLGRTTAPGEATNGGVVVDAGRVTDGVEASLRLAVAASIARPLARAIVVSVLVSAGFFLVYGMLAGVVTAVGASSLAGISVLELLVGLVLVLVGGLMALGWIPELPTARLPARRRSAGGYLGFGVLYAAAAAGCTAPIFIGVALKALSVGPATGLLAFGAYAAGMSVIMLGVTVAAALGRETLLVWFGRRLDRLHRAAGVLLVLAGLLEIYLFVFRFDGLGLLGL